MQAKVFTSLTLTLREQISRSALTQQGIKQATALLKANGYSYDQEKYPPLPVFDPSLIPAGNQGPITLAEALLWKLGKWGAYKNFAAFYHSGATVPRPSTSVVFDAFALHLKDRRYSIFDQHSLRSVWSICNLSKAELGYCKSFLINQKGEWKDSGSGSSGVQCYTLFTQHVKKLRRQSGATLEDLDRLLMPLGQALKDLSVTYQQFCAEYQLPRAPNRSGPAATA